MTRRRLDHAAVNPVRGEVTRLIEKPDPLPLFGDLPEVFRREDQLAGPDCRIARINRNEAAYIGGQANCDDSSQNPLPHDTILRECDRNPLRWLILRAEFSQQIAIVLIRSLLNCRLVLDRG